jgi:hypothetical protein
MRTGSAVARVEIQQQAAAAELQLSRELACRVQTPMPAMHTCILHCISDQRPHTRLALGLSTEHDTHSHSGSHRGGGLHNMHSCWL